MADDLIGHFEASAAPRQVMSAEELGRMRSQYSAPDGRALTLDEAYHRPDIWFNANADRIARNSGYRDARDRHDALRRSIREHGIRNSIFYDPDTLEVGAGHHRYFAGRDEDLAEFPVNDGSVREKYENVDRFDDLAPQSGYPGREAAARPDDSMHLPDGSALVEGMSCPGCGHHVTKYKGVLWNEDDSPHDCDDFVHEAAARPGRGEKTCKCCKGNGEHPDGSECGPCDGSGLMHRENPDVYCPGQPQPRRRHWREASMPQPDYDPSEELPEGRGIFYRSHLKGAPLDEAHARSRNLETPSAGQRGYSAFASPHHLSQYMDEYGWIGSHEVGWPHREVVAFHGREVGRGADNEPLVIPQANPHCCGQVVHSRMPWGEFERKIWDENPPESIPAKPWDTRRSPDPAQKSVDRHRRRHGRNVTAPADDGGMTGNPWDSIRTASPDEYGRYVYPDYPRARTPAALAGYFREHEPGYYEQVRRSIGAHGVQEPVLLRYRDPHGTPLERPVVMSGHHRAAAAWEEGADLPVGDYDNQEHYDASTTDFGRKWWRDHHELKARYGDPRRKEAALEAPADDGGTQRMSVEDLLSLHSNEALARKRHFADPRAEHGDDTRVSTVYDRKAAEMARNPAAWGQLDEPIRNGTIDPVLLSRTGSGLTEVTEGQHRIVRAHQLGVSHLPVSYDPGSQEHRYDWEEPEPLDDRLQAEAAGRPDYQGGHHPISWKSQLHDVTDIPRAYDDPRKYLYGEGDKETLRQFRQARGNPDHPVRVYRAMPLTSGGRINTGDWVSLGRDAAIDLAHERNYQDPDSLMLDDEPPGHERYHSYEATVPARQVRSGGNDLMEWGYWGDPVQGEHSPGCCSGHPAALEVPAAAGDEPSDDYKEILGHFGGAAMEQDQRPVHRGIGIALSPEDEVVVGDESLPAAYRARHLLDVVTRDGHEPLGQHWTTDQDQARFFSGPYRGSPGPAWQVMFHATRPEPREIITDPAWREEHEANDSEDEVSVHPHAEMELTGVSWKPRGGEWTRHQLDEPEYHRAGTSDTAHAGSSAEGGLLGHFEAVGTEDYGMSHRPLRDGAPAHDLTEGYAEDIYTHPQYWSGGGPPNQAEREGLKQLRDARGNPDHPVTIYRASPPGSPLRMHTGDWVSLSPSYAQEHADSRNDPDGWFVHKAVVPASHVRDAGTAQYTEQGYWGPGVDSEHHWTHPGLGHREAASPEEYGVSHRPDLGGPPLHDLTEGDMMPRDIYERMHEYNLYSHDPGLLGEAAWKAMGKVRKFQGQPEKKVRIWRSAPAVNPESRNAKRGEINHGDWIGLSREKALAESYEVNDPSSGSLPANHPDRYHIWSALVPAKHVRNPDGDLTEWGYSGPDLKDLTHHSESCSHRARVKPREAAAEDHEPEDGSELLGHFEAALPNPGSTGETAPEGHEIWAEPHGTSPVAADVLHNMHTREPEDEHGSGWYHGVAYHGPYHIVRHPQTRETHVVDAQGRDASPHQRSYGNWQVNGTYGEKMAEEHWHGLESQGPDAHRTGTAGEPKFSELMKERTPAFPHSRIDPEDIERVNRPAPRVHAPEGYSPDDEYHGSYEVVRHPETGKFHVVDNAGRKTSVLPLDGHDTQLRAERSRDYIEKRQQSKERARGIADKIWGEETDEEREGHESERNLAEAQNLMSRYEGGRGEIKFDDDEEGGAPYYEREHHHPNGQPSGWYIKHYNGTRGDIYHRATGDRAHDMLRLTSHEMADGSEHLSPAYGDEDLAADLKEWHDRPDGMRRYLEEDKTDRQNDPAIARWKQRHTGSIEAQAQLIHEDMDEAQLRQHMRDRHGFIDTADDPDWVIDETHRREHADALLEHRHPDLESDPEWDEEVGENLGDKDFLGQHGIEAARQAQAARELVGHFEDGDKAIAAPEAHNPNLRNPYHGTPEFGGRDEWSHTWFHGITGRHEPDLSTGRPGEQQRSAGSSWPQPNKLIGTHMTPLRSVAQKFAHGVYASGRPGDERYLPGVPSAIVHARLHMQNPVHFPTEKHLNLDIARYANDHFPGWHDDKLNNDLGWNCSDQEGTHRNWHAENSYRHDAPYADKQDFNRLAGQAQQVLQWHPRLPEIMEGYRSHLESRGHDGLTYGNEVEGPGDFNQDVRHISAIAIRPSQIETIHVERIAPPNFGRPSDPPPDPGQISYRDSEKLSEPEDMLRRISDFHSGHGGALPGKTAAAQAITAARYEPGLPNPHTGGQDWFHGTQSRPEDLHHGFAGPMGHSQYDEEMNGHLSYWNTHLGPHFAASHGIADHFAESGASNADHDDNDYGPEPVSRYERDEPPRSVVHVRLHLRNPKVYASEHDMDNEVYEHETAAGNWISNHFEHGYEHEDPSHPDFDPTEVSSDEEWPLAARFRHDSRQPLIGADEAPHQTIFNPNHPGQRMRAQWLSSHPDKGNIARRFRERLEAQGHDGIIYGNELETDHAGSGPHARTCAIAFHPEHQAEVTQHHDPDRPCLSPAEAENQRRRMPQAGQEELPGVEDEADEFPGGFRHGSSLDVVAHFEPRTAAPYHMQQKLFHAQPDPSELPEDSSRHNPADPKAMTRWRQEHEEGYVPPPETWDHPEYGIRDDESGLYRHPEHGGYHCHACTQHNGEPVFHDDAQTAEDHGTTVTDWDREYPRLPETLHRGLRIDGDGYSTGSRFLHEIGRAGSLPEHDARELIGAIGNLGEHWTPEESQARHYSAVGAGGHGSDDDLNVVLHMRKPEREDIETDPETLAERNVYGMDYHDDAEVPLREGAPVHLTGVSWKRHGDPDDAWLHHDLAEPAEHTAALEAGAVAHFMDGEEHEIPPWSGGTLLHGTRSVLQPGDVLTPGEAARHPAHPSEVSEGYVHVTPNGDEAQYWAQHADPGATHRRMTELGLGREPSFERGENQGHAYPPRVYEVEPSGPVEPDPNGEGMSYRSAHPVRVVREVRPLQCYDCPDTSRNEEHWPGHPHYDYLQSLEDEDDDEGTQHTAGWEPEPDRLAEALDAFRNAPLQPYMEPPQDDYDDHALHLITHHGIGPGAHLPRNLPGARNVHKGLHSPGAAGDPGHQHEHPETGMDPVFGARELVAHFGDDDEDYDEEPGEESYERVSPETDEDGFTWDRRRGIESGEIERDPDVVPRCCHCSGADGEVRHWPDEGHSPAVERRLAADAEREARWDRGEYDRTRYCDLGCEISHHEDLQRGIGVHHTFAEGEPEAGEIRPVHGDMPQLNGPFEEPAGRGSGRYEVRNPSAEHRCHYCRNILPQYRREGALEVTAMAGDEETHDPGHFEFYRGLDRDSIEPRTHELEDHLRTDHAYGNWRMDQDLEHARDQAYGNDEDSTATRWRNYHANMERLHSQVHERALDNARSAIEHGAPAGNVERTRAELESAHHPQLEAEREEQREHQEAVAEHRENGSVNMHGSRVGFDEMEAHLREAHGIPHEGLPEYRLPTYAHGPDRYEQDLEEAHQQAHGEMGSYRHDAEYDPAARAHMHSQPLSAWDAEHHLVQHHGFDLDELRRDEPSYDELERQHAEDHETNRHYLTHHLADEMDEEGHVPHHEWGDHDEEQYQATGQIPGYRHQQAQLGEYRHNPDYGELEAPGDEPDTHDTAFSYRHQPYMAPPRSREDLWKHIHEDHGINQRSESGERLEAGGFGTPDQQQLISLHDRFHAGELPDGERLGLGTPHQHDIPGDHHDPVFGSAQGAGLVQHFASSGGDRYVTCGQGHQHWGAYGAAGLLIRHRGDDGQVRYLLQKRSPEVHEGGTWSTPGGAIGRGESPEEGARREAEEEFGELPRGLAHHHTFTDDHGGGWAYHTVVMDSPRQFTPGGGDDDSDWESEGHGWFTPAEMHRLPLHPGFAASWGRVQHSGALQPGPDQRSAREDRGDRWWDYQNRYSEDLHRGIHVGLPRGLDEYVHNENEPREDRARALQAHFSGSGLGMHWTPHVNIANRAINNEADSNASDDEEYFSEHPEAPRDTATDVIFHVRRPGERNRLRNPEDLEDHQVGWKYSRDEDEFPVKAGAPLRLTGISWKRHEPEYPNEPYEHVDFPKPVRHVSSRQAPVPRGELVIASHITDQVAAPPDRRMPAITAAAVSSLAPDAVSARQAIDDLPAFFRALHEALAALAARMDDLPLDEDIPDMVRSMAFSCQAAAEDAEAIARRLPGHSPEGTWHGPRELEPPKD